MLPTTGVYTRRVVIATEGKDHTTFQRFAEEIVKHASSG